MDLGAAGLNEQPFRTHGKPLSTVSYASYKEGFEVLENTFENSNGLSLLLGLHLYLKHMPLHRVQDTIDL